MEPNLLCLCGLQGSGKSTYAKKLKYDFEKGTFSNPCIQQDTSMTQVFQNALDVPQGTPAFSENELIHIYKDFDVLFSDYDPEMIALQKELDAQVQKQSQINSEQNDTNG